MAVVTYPLQSWWWADTAELERIAEEYGDTDPESFAFRHGLNPSQCWPRCMGLARRRGVRCRNNGRYDGWCHAHRRTEMEISGPSSKPSGDR